MNHATRAGKLHRAVAEVTVMVNVAVVVPAKVMRRYVAVDRVSGRVRRSEGWRALDKRAPENE